MGLTNAQVLYFAAKLEEILQIFRGQHMITYIPGRYSIGTYRPNYSLPINIPVGAFTTSGGVYMSTPQSRNDRIDALALAFLQLMDMDMPPERQPEIEEKVNWSLEGF